MTFDDREALRAQRSEQEKKAQIEFERWKKEQGVESGVPLKSDMSKEGIKLKSLLEEARHFQASKEGKEGKEPK